jgi:hypothetical protein
VALYWDNIDPKLVTAQAKVFGKFGYQIEQICKTGLQHGDFLDGIMAELTEDETVLCMDIDCFPTNREIVERAFLAAENGGLLGCAQVASHVDPLRIYTAPAFLALSARTWRALGRPSFKAHANGDVGQTVHDVAVAAGVRVEYLYPWACVIPKWTLADQALFGSGTFFQGGVFHLFESRASLYAFVAHQVADDVLAGRDTDVIALCQRAMRRQPFEPMFARWTKFKKSFGRKRN